VLALAAGDIGSENMTLNSYTPVPIGIYRQLVTTGGTSSPGVNTLLVRDGGKLIIGDPPPATNNHKMTVIGNTGVGAVQWNIYNPTNATDSMAGFRFSTASGWDVMLRTRQNVAWLELTDSGGGVKHRWIGQNYRAYGRLGVKIDPATSIPSPPGGGTSPIPEVSVHGTLATPGAQTGRVRAQSYVYGARDDCTNNTTANGSCPAAQYATWAKGIRFLGRWELGLPKYTQVGAVQSNVNFWCCPK